jgi:hypothetical protein
MGHPLPNYRKTLDERGDDSGDVRQPDYPESNQQAVDAESTRGNAVRTSSIFLLRRLQSTKVAHEGDLCG